MAKGPIITDEVRQYIAEEYLTHPKYRAKEIQKTVVERLHKDNPRLQRGWPGLSIVQKELTKIRNSHRSVIEESILEEIWDLYSYKTFEIPPEVLPTILKLWLCSREEDGEYLTNREVIWAVRLHAVYKDIKMLKERAKGLAFSDLLCDIGGHAGPLAHWGKIRGLVEHLTGQKVGHERVALPNRTDQAKKHLSG